MTALIVGAALAVATLVYVLLPLFDAIVPTRSRPASRGVAGPESAIDALREIEFDRATGKLSDDDYSALKAEYTRSALVEMRSKHPSSAAGEGENGESAVDAAAPNAAVDGLDAVEAAVMRYRSVRRECETCGPRPEPDPAFCSSCGKYLKGTCGHCGATIEAPASRFCPNCGSSLAA